jgi:hypothetical protein
MMELKDQRRFWAKVNVTDDVEDCWEWLSGRNKRGYGNFRLGSRKVLSHRLAYEEIHGPIPEDKVIRHSCDHPSCCNPNHLREGSSKII